MTIDGKKIDDLVEANRGHDEQRKVELEQLRNLDPAKKPYLSDVELCERWRCSAMRLWRLRAGGKLDPGIKPGGTGSNLNRMSHILEIEARAEAEAREAAANRAAALARDKVA